MDEIATACRLLLGGVFAWSCLSKVPDLGAFADTIRAHIPTLGPAASAIAALIVLVEGFAAASLLSGYALPLGLILAFGLLGTFLVVMLRNLRRATPLPCHCFGASDEDAHPRLTLARIGLLLGAAAIASTHQGHGLPSVEAIGQSLSLLGIGLWTLHLPGVLSARAMPISKDLPRTRTVSLRDTPLTPIQIVPGETP